MKLSIGTLTLDFTCLRIFMFLQLSLIDQCIYLIRPILVINKKDMIAQKILLPIFLQFML